MLLTKSTDIRVLSISLKVTSNLFRQQHWLKQQLKIIYSLAEVPIIRQLAKRDYDKEQNVRNCLVQKVLYQVLKMTKI